LLQLSSQEQEAVAVFDERARNGILDHAPVWADNFSSFIFLDLPGQGEVVDVGCGTGRFVPILPDLSIKQYLGIDPSPESIAYCRHIYPEQSFAVGSIQTLGAKYPGRFSGFIMTACLMHVPRRGLRAALRSLRSALMLGAQGMMSLPIGEPLTWRHPLGLTTTLYTEAEMLRQLPLHGLEIRQMFRPSKYMLLLHVEAV
jgi:SAM-dependent methyltransferase